MPRYNLKSSLEKIDSFFSADSTGKATLEGSQAKHARAVKRTKLLLPCIAAAILGLLIVYPKIKQDLKSVGIDITKPKIGELEKLHIENTVFNITDDKNQVHNFTAKNVDETEAGSKLIKLIQPRGNLPLDAKTWVDAESPTGFYNQNTKVLKLTDNAEMFYSEGMNMEMFEVDYDFGKAYGYSESKVKGDGVFGKVSADGMEFFYDTSVLIFKGKTDITIYKRKPTDEEIDIKAQKQVEIYKNQNKVIAIGNAVVSQKGTDVNADRITGFFEKNGEDMQLDKVYAIGNVVITQGKNVLRGEEAETDMKTGISRIISKKGRVSGVFKEKEKKDDQ